MTELPTLDGTSLNNINAKVGRPEFDFMSIKIGIVHVSLGAFHRSHQAIYTDSLLAKEGGNWGICGVGALPSDKNLIEDLKFQDHLYTVMTRSAEGNKARIVGSLRDVIFMPDNPAAVIEKLCSANTKILSLTITEKGYCHNPQTGLLNPEHPMIAHDLKNLNKPQSAIGLIVAGLKARMEKNMPAFTVMSCDNLPHNGDKTASIVTAFAKLIDDKLATWIETNVAFPNTMVDRITPVTTQDDIQTIADEFGYEDKAVVVCEPFIQWVLEDKFPLGRPAWEKIGAQFVSDVSPYELAKIRLLNVPHTIFAYPAYLMGFEWVSDGASNPLLARYVRNVMDKEITPTLPPVLGMELESYKTTIIERFANPAIKDTWARICSDGSQKIANQLVPIMRERFAKGEDADGLILLLAVWFRYLTGKLDNGTSYKIDDPMADQLQKIALNAKQDPMPFLHVKEIFGDDIPKNDNLVNKLRKNLADIYKQGTAKVITAHYGT